jgi:HEAT repeat protein
VVALGKIGRSLNRDDAVWKKLSMELKDIATKPEKDKYTAMYAALALAIMGDNAANDYFEEYLSEANRTHFQQEVHSAMAMAVGLLEDHAAVHDLREIVTRGRVEDDYRGYAAFALGVMGDQKSKETILKTMEEEKRRQDLLRSGCWAIGLLGGREDIPKLIDMLKLDDKGNHQVRGAAAIAIGLIGDSQAVKPLLTIARIDPDTSNRAFAIAALGCLIDKDPVPRIPQLFANIHFRHEPAAIRKALMNL